MDVPLSDADVHSDCYAFIQPIYLPDCQQLFTRPGLYTKTYRSYPYEHRKVDRNNTGAILLGPFRSFSFKVHEVPAQHQWHQRLVELLQGIQKRPGPPSKTFDFWYYLPLFFG
jgi:hypothetical protein